MTFGENLRNLRKERDLSIKELASLSGLSVVQISNYEHEKNMPNAITVAKLVIALKCEYGDLVKR